MRDPIRSARQVSLEEHAVLTLGISTALVVVWALTTRWYFWPIHAILPLTALLAIHGWVALLTRRPGIERRLGGHRPAVALGIAGVLWLYFAALWAEGGGGYFWPAWPLLGLVTLAGVAVLASPRAFPLRHRGERS